MCNAAAEDQEGDGINLAAPKRRKRTWEQASDEEEEDPEAVEAARKEAEMEADRSAHINNINARVPNFSLAFTSHGILCISSKLPWIESSAWLSLTNLQCKSSSSQFHGLIFDISGPHRLLRSIPQYSPCSWLQQVCICMYIHKWRPFIKFPSNIAYLSLQHVAIHRSTSHIQLPVNHKDFICSVVEPTNVLEHSLIKHHLTCDIIKHQYIYNNTIYHIDTKHVQGGARGL